MAERVFKTLVVKLDRHGTETGAYFYKAETKFASWDKAITNMRRSIELSSGEVTWLNLSLKEVFEETVEERPDCSLERQKLIRTVPISIGLNDEKNYKVAPEVKRRELVGVAGEI